MASGSSMAGTTPEVLTWLILCVRKVPVGVIGVCVCVCIGNSREIVGVCV